MNKLDDAKTPTWEATAFYVLGGVSIAYAMASPVAATGFVMMLVAVVSVFSGLVSARKEPIK
jgi:hypothetical protein